MHGFLTRLLAGVGGLVVLGTSLSGVPAVADAGPKPVSTPNRLAADFDGDGRADAAVWRPSNATFYFVRSDNGVRSSQQIGGAGDTPVTGDYDGDGRSDFTVWTDADHSWEITLSSNDLITQNGSWGDVPFALDFDGDSRPDRTVWRPSNRTWYILRSKDGGQTIQTYGDR